VLAHESGHRIGAIRQLQWADVDLEAATIRWRAENEKTGYEHVTPMTEAAPTALEVARSGRPGIGEAPLLPAPKDESAAVGRHSLRRKFASDLMHEPLKVLCELGGWKSPHTVLICYQQADEPEMRRALATKRSGSGGG